jgi:hypothetical protein
MALGTLPGIEPVTVFRLGEPLVVYRIVKSASPFDPALADSFKSNYELGRPPRRTEVRFTPTHMGISVYLAQERARETAVVWPRLGEYIAEVNLEPDIGAAFALTAQPGHLTVWGRAPQLLAAVADIVPVEG